MPITFGQARDILAPFAGVSGADPASDTTALFVRKVLQYMLYSGTNGDQRVFDFHAVRGWITLPHELQTPLKIKIGGVVGNVWDKWFTWKHGGEEPGCLDASSSLYEDPNTYATAYELSSGGGHVAVLGTLKEADDAHIIVSGTDLAGREVITHHQGKEIAGEYISIQKGRLIASNVKFGKIRSIHKTRTNGYVQLFSVDSNGLNKKFLSDYTPHEEIPQYRRCKITAPCPGEIVKVSILARIRLKDHYADTDTIPFENLFAIEVAGQTVRANRNDDVQTAAAKDALMTKLITQENSHKQPNNGQPMVDVYRPLANGSIRRPY